MRIAVLGADGMLGHKMYQTVRARFPDTTGTLLGSADTPLYRVVPLLAEGTMLHDFDVMQMDVCLDRLRALRPDVVINCIGIIKQRKTASDSVLCIAINSLWPHKLALAVASWGGRTIHFSTDCVFDGRKGGYTEQSRSDAEDLYGQTKFLGEIQGEGSLTLRTSIIGRELEHFASLLEWLLSQRGGTIRGYRNVIYSGVTTNHIADRVCDLIERFAELSGLYHLTAPAISKYELLVRLNEAFGLNITVEADDAACSDRSMIGDRFYDTTGLEQPTWDALVAQLAEDPTPYDDWRQP